MTKGQERLMKGIIVILTAMLVVSIIQLVSVVIAKIPVNILDVVPYDKHFDFLIVDNPSKIFHRGDMVSVKFHVRKYQSYPETTYRTLICVEGGVEIVKILDTIHKNIPVGDTEAVLSNLYLPYNAPSGECYVRYLVTHKLENGRQDNDPASTELFWIVD